MRSQNIDLGNSPSSFDLKSRLYFFNSISSIGVGSPSRRPGIGKTTTNLYPAPAQLNRVPLEGVQPGLNSCQWRAKPAHLPSKLNLSESVFGMTRNYSTKWDGICKQRERRTGVFSWGWKSCLPRSFGKWYWGLPCENHEVTACRVKLTQSQHREFNLAKRFTGV